MLSQLFAILPTLALLNLVLTGVESVPHALAHQANKRNSRDAHRHLINRQNAAKGIAEQVEKRRVPKGAIIRRGANGQMCRVRGSTPTLTPVSSTIASVSTTSTSAPSAVYSQVTYVSSNVVTTTYSASSVDATYVAAFQSADPTTTVVAAAVQSSDSSTININVNANANTYSGSTASGWTNSHSKFGAAWPNGNWPTPSDPDYIGNYIGKRTAWYYTWSPFPVGSGDSLGLEFVPMLWGPKQVGDWYAQQPSWPSTVKNALFFNEPNEGSQCNMSPGDSVSYWMNEMVPLRAKGISLGSAATTSAPSGLQWILDFKQACVGAGNSDADCTPDFVPIHWYDVTPENFQQYVQNFHDKTGSNLWVTEYACQNFNNGPQCSNDQTWALHQQMADWFDQQPYVLRYAPFGMMEQMQGVNQDNALMNPDGTITSLGSWYINH